MVNYQGFFTLFCFLFFLVTVGVGRQQGQGCLSFQPISSHDGLRTEGGSLILQGRCRGFQENQHRKQWQSKRKKVGEHLYWKQRDLGIAVFLQSGGSQPQLRLESFGGCPGTMRHDSSIGVRPEHWFVFKAPQVGPVCSQFEDKASPPSGTRQKCQIISSRTIESQSAF